MVSNFLIACSPPVAASDMHEWVAFSRWAQYKCKLFSSILLFPEKPNEASKTIIVWIRNTQDFSDINALNTLYFSLVRFIIEHASFVWYPHQLTFIERLNKINNKYRRISLFWCGGTLAFKSFADIDKEKFTSRLSTNYLVDSPDLLSWLPIISVSFFNLRHQSFNNKLHSTHIGSASPFDLCAI